MLIENQPKSETKKPITKADMTTQTVLYVAYVASLTYFIGSDCVLDVVKILIRNPLRLSPNEIEVLAYSGALTLWLVFVLFRTAQKYFILYKEYISQSDQIPTEPPFIDLKGVWPPTPRLPS